ncbi:hypothetical protein [Leptolyngbya sp. FACHB-261]|uniref:hypothetical protein n=1 Tax=Leptolyngbya sp. FACHB-261 TaxID=2692806 RepID=UPI0016876EFF|nr:hypothetical protein [Leptolyngbya sp. FACHB-261]MBD2101148.1 hypothetical protein [Leptolyngbya sp. FACHB-261]
MRHLRLPRSSNPVWIQRLIGASLLVLLATPSQAHEVKTSIDVGGTLHVEPNDNPQAGKSTLAWVALTRSGGQILPLAQCDCKLKVYAKSQSEGKPLLEPSLRAVTVGQYQGIPGADIIFPEAGAYELEISGTPAAGASFAPFELDFAVTVRAGAATVPSSQAGATAQAVEPAATAARETRANSTLPIWMGLAVVLGLGILGFGFSRVRSKQPTPDSPDSESGSQ